MKQRHATSKARFFALQPGDATLYTFFFVPIPEIFAAEETTEDNEPISTMQERYMFSGWGSGTYALGLCRTDKTNIAFVSRYTIEHWQEIGEWRLEEVACKLSSTLYTARVLLAAISVLLVDPADTALACKQMMEAGATLTG